MSENIISIIALICSVIGVFCVFWRRDIMKDKTSNWIMTTIGFVVLCISLLVIYFAR